MKKYFKSFAAVVGVALAFAVTGCQPQVTHEHTFADSWSFNESQHWKAATCEHTDEVSSKGDHVLGDWVDGIKECTICKYKMSCSHSYGPWNDGVRECSICKLQDICHHKYGDWNIAKIPTESEEGSMERTCSRCGKIDSNVIAKTDHVHYWSPNYSKDDQHHWKICYRCAEKKEYEAHDFATEKERVPATCVGAGYVVYECKCGATHKEVITPTGVHIYENGKCTAGCYRNLECEGHDEMVKLNDNGNIFWVSNTELTYGKWSAVLDWAKSNGYTFESEGKKGSLSASLDATDKHPVTYVSWRDAIVWCNAASEKEGLTPVYWKKGEAAFVSKAEIVRNSTNDSADNSVVNPNANGYRLPTKDEWKFAADGNKKSTYSGGDDIETAAWYKNNSDDKTHEVRLKNANQFCMTDMSGNVWEWCQESMSTDEYRMILGGCYSSVEGKCQITMDIEHCVGSRRTSEKQYDMGFRVVKSEK